MDFHSSFFFPTSPTPLALIGLVPIGTLSPFCGMVACALCPCLSSSSVLHPCLLYFSTLIPNRFS